MKVRRFKKKKDHTKAWAEAWDNQLQQQHKVAKRHQDLASRAEKQRLKKARAEYESKHGKWDEDNDEEEGWRDYIAHENDYYDNQHKKGGHKKWD
jgi:hypothetical protein